MITKSRPKRDTEKSVEAIRTAERAKRLRDEFYERYNAAKARQEREAEKS